MRLVRVAMQPSSPPAAPPPMYPMQRSRLPLFLAIGALVLLVIGGVVGFLLGSAGLGQATLLINVTNNTASAVSAQVLVNGQLVTTLSIPSGQTMSASRSVTFGTANGAYFNVQAIVSSGPHDSSSIFVNAAGTYVATLRLG